MLSALHVHQPLPDVLRCMLTGYAAPDAAAGVLLPDLKSAPNVVQ